MILLLWYLTIFVLTLWYINAPEQEAQRKRDKEYRDYIKLMQDAFEFQRKQFYESCQN